MFTYDTGFIKRGLIGSVVGYWVPQLTLETLHRIQSYYATFNSIIFASLVSLCISRAINCRQKGQGILLASILVLLLTSSGSVQQIFFDLGRFDTFGFTLILIALIFILVSSSSTAFCIIIFINFLALLIHEAFIFWVVPISFGLWYFHTGGRGVPRWLFVLAALLILACFGVVFSSSYNDIAPLAVVLERLEMRSDFSLNEASLRIHYRTLSENIVYTAERSFTLRRILGIFISVPVLSAYVWLLWFVSAQGWTRRLFVLWIVAIAPLGLFVVGHDHARWLAMVNFNLCMATVLVLWSVKDELRPNLRATAFLAFFSILQLGLGPFGVSASFPELSSWIVLLAY